MDRLTAMRVFAEVATSGSFSATADKLDMSRAMVTRYVAEMEQWLQARLLQRTTRSVTLTDAGELALRRCQQMLALTTDLEEETATTAEGELRGQLRLTCSVSFAYAQLGAAIADFLARHPQLKIDLDASEGSLNLVERRIDLAIRISAEPDSMLIGRPLAQCDSVLVASPAYLAAHGTPQQPADLARHRCLSYANFGKSVWQLSRGDVVERVSVTSPFSANEATTLMRAALAGGGIALQPTYLV
ncbi:MAG TPA: LysR family transcriptional regulator, partial [Acidovorax temperans]|nr:LysR family transcriptional regulator [Acidovorax temperans]